MWQYGINEWLPQFIITDLTCASTLKLITQLRSRSLDLDLVLEILAKLELDLEI